MHFEDNCFDKSHDMRKSFGLQAKIAKRLVPGAVPMLMKAVDSMKREETPGNDRRRGAYLKRERSRVRINY